MRRCKADNGRCFLLSIMCVPTECGYGDGERSVKKRIEGGSRALLARCILIKFDLIPLHVCFKPLTESISMR